MPVSLSFGFHMQTWSDPPWLAVSGCAVDHVAALLSAHLQSVTLVQMLSYHSHVDLMSRDFPK
ncbi:unnamed protein product [Callosobruchus maculatus]|uniref:Uncharacterized protein n=1 Tax=Callosobruchus maculatus TaxID=64391 RepID=A0A653DG13_CALMS|nr:unnamed protein product [Callosobruchus maculatus]